ncbi:hypothetical protein ACFQZT_12700 [Paenibacillus sp. GCM10027628]|uniref:hypothetical protein n=1 Tax=Paenibacillus sp. GCM10027628 TaxID=3273413 RepID=UPI0036257F77
MEIKCLDCFDLTESFISLRMNQLESILDYFDDLAKYVGKYDESMFLEHNGKLRCSNCNEKIELDDFFIPRNTEAEFIKKVCQLLGERLSDFVDYCSKCDVIMELNEVNNISFEEIGEKQFSEGILVEKFIVQHEIPQQYSKYILPYLRCKCCGYGYDRENQEYDIGRFDNNIKIYKFEEINNFFDIDMEEWHQFAEEYNILIRSFEITNFLSYLKRNPMLGYRHPVGRKFYELFKKMYDNQDYLLLEKGNFYRGRTRAIGSSQFKDENMWNPPFGVSSHGRFNLIGSSVLYLTNSKKFVPYEVNFTNSDELDIATIMILKPLKILDLSKLIGDFGRFLSQSPHTNNFLKLEYLLTNYISECCKEIGFNGIKYKGVREGDYDNYALINFEREVI